MYVEVIMPPRRVPRLLGHVLDGIAPSALRWLSRRLNPTLALATTFGDFERQRLIVDGWKARFHWNIDVPSAKEATGASALTLTDMEAIVLTPFLESPDKTIFDLIACMKAAGLVVRCALFDDPTYLRTMERDAPRFQAKDFRRNQLVWQRMDLGKGTGRLPDEDGDDSAAGTAVLAAAALFPRWTRWLGTRVPAVWIPGYRAWCPATRQYQNRIVMTASGSEVSLNLTANYYRSMAIAVPKLIVS